jgi:hypothetical protein
MPWAFFFVFVNAETKCAIARSKSYKENDDAGQIDRENSCASRQHGCVSSSASVKP